MNAARLLVSRRFFFHLTLLAALALGCQTAAAEFDPPALYLSWIDDPTTTMVVHWQTPGHDVKQARLDYRKAGDDTWRQLVGQTRVFPKPTVPKDHRAYGKYSVIDRFVHIVGLTELEPGATYEFRVYGEEASGVYRFRTMSAAGAAAKKIRFVNGGDLMHEPDMMRRINVIAGKANPDFALIGGDLAYADGLDGKRWAAFFDVWRETMVRDDGTLIPMLVAIGNHEVDGGYGRTPKQAPYFYTLFALPGGKPYYAIDFADHLSIVVLDSNHTTPVRRQTGWLDRTLQARRDVPHLFACYHYPAYGTVKTPRDSYSPLDHGLSKLIRKEWTPLFDKYQVDLAFEHDHHCYKRSKPLRGHKVRPDDEKATIYLGDGAWGVRLRTPKEDLPYLEKSGAVQHFFLIDIDGNKRTIKAINAEGKVFDEFEQVEAAENRKTEKQENRK